MSRYKDWQGFATRLFCCYFSCRLSVHWTTSAQLA